MNKCQPPFTVESKIYKDTQSSNPNEPSQRIIKVVITLNDQNSNDNAQDNMHSNVKSERPDLDSIKSILTISSSYVRESPPHNLPKKTTTLHPKVKLVEQITQYEEKIDSDDLNDEVQTSHRSLGPPAFNSPRYKKSSNIDKSKENDNYNSNMNLDNFTDLSPKTNIIDQRKKKSNIFSRTSKINNEGSQVSSIKEKSFQNHIPENLVQIKREDKNKYDFTYTQQVNPKKIAQVTYQKPNPKRTQYQKQDYFYEEESNEVIEEPPKVPIIFRSHKSHKAPPKNKPYFSTSTLPIEVEKPERIERAERIERTERLDRLDRTDRAERMERTDRTEKIGKTKKIEKSEKRFNRKILRIPTVNDDLPIFHEDPPEVQNNKKTIDQNEEPLLLEEEEIQDSDNAISFAPSNDDNQAHDNIRRKIDFTNSPVSNKKENNQLENINPNNLEQKEEEFNKFDFNDSNEEEDLLVSDDEDDYMNDNLKFNQHENDKNENEQTNFVGSNVKNDQKQQFNYDDLDENKEYDGFNVNHPIENKSSNKATNLVIEPIELNTNINKLYQQQNRFSKIENQLIFEENPDEEFDQNKFINDQINIAKPPISTSKPSNLTFNNQTALNIQLENEEEEEVPSKPFNNEKMINITFDDKNNFENSHDTIDQTQTVISSDIKSGVSINLSPIKKLDNEDILNDDENQVSSLSTKENEDKKDENFWMFIPVDKKKRKKEINITQNMSKVVNVSRNYVKGVQAFRSLSMLLNQHRYEHFIMNLDKENQKLLGIYTLNDRMSQIKKIWGDGPEKATLDDVNSSLLYNPSSKKFSNVDPSFNQDVDAVFLK